MLYNSEFYIPKLASRYSLIQWLVFKFIDIAGVFIVVLLVESTKTRLSSREFYGQVKRLVGAPAILISQSFFVSDSKYYGSLIGHED